MYETNGFSRLLDSFMDYVVLLSQVVMTRSQPYTFFFDK